MDVLAFGPSPLRRFMAHTANKIDHIEAGIDSVPMRYSVGALGGLYASTQAERYQ